MSKYTIFHLTGGLGKHVAGTAVAQAIKNNYPDRKLIVACGFAELFTNLKFVHRAFNIGSTQYFYQEYVQDCDSLIFHNEPYYTTSHIHKQKHLIESWCEMYGLKYSGEMPVFKLNKLQMELAENHWIRDKPLMVIHTNGGLQATNSKPYAWTRDIPHDLAQRIVNHYSKKYHIYQVTKMNSPKLEGAEHIFATKEQALSSIELLSLIPFTSKRLLIDSCLQHAAAAKEMPSTVLWNGTDPRIFGYDIHDNICTEIDKDFNLPGSMFFDFDFNGQELEYPFDDDEEEVELYDFDQIIESINQQ